MKVLVTGSTGFIGSRLIEGGAFDFRAVVRKSGTSLCDDEYPVSAFDQETDWKEALGSVEAVVHLAGVAHRKNSSPGDFFAFNYRATVNLASQCAERGVKRFVNISSIGVNGRSTSGIPFSEMMGERPHDDYAASKFQAENALNEIAGSTGLEVVNVRPTLVYGFNAPGNFGALSKLIRLTPCLPFGLLKNRRSFVSVNNLNDFIRVCLIHPSAANQTFIVADGESVSTRQFTDAIAKGLNKELIQLPVPLFALKALGSLTGKSAQIEQVLGDLEVDTSKARRLLGWRPPENMEQAMRELSGENTA